VAPPATPVVQLDTTAEVETPEHVRFRYRLAGPARRGVAYLIDLVIRLAFALGVIILLSLTVGGAGGLDSMSAGVSLLILFAVEWGYYVVFETLWSGRTPGKRALGLRVVREAGYPIGFNDSVLRNLLRAADFLPFAYGLGLIVCAADPRFRRLGDLAAGTMVVAEDRGRVTPRIEISPPPTPEELAAIPSRVLLSPEERDAIELYLRREPFLHPARSLELAEMVAPMFARRLSIRPTDPGRFLALLYHRMTSAGPRQAAPGRKGKT
jgi:uncharacterized RDD family membrane protein YckC